jgi:hypothetical protein
MDISDLTKSVRNHALKDAYAKAYEAGRELTTDEEVERHLKGIQEAFRKGVEKTRKEESQVKAIKDFEKAIKGLDPKDIREVLCGVVGSGFNWATTPEGPQFWRHVSLHLITGHRHLRDET